MDNMGEPISGQSSLFDGTNESSSLDTVNGYRSTEEFQLGVNYSLMMDLEGNTDNNGGGRFPSNAHMSAENVDGACYSRESFSFSPLSTSTNRVSDLMGNSWESQDLGLDRQHIADSTTPETEGSDGSSGPPDEPERRNPPLHQAKIECLWTRPMRCLLEGCRSTYFFPTAQSFKSHIENVHKKAVFCSVPACTFGRPFANNTDLKRHVDAIHRINNKGFRCEREHCSRKVKAWHRKDKLKLHNEKYHSNFRCFFCSESPRHQRWFDTESELFAHTISEHSNNDR